MSVEITDAGRAAMSARVCTRPEIGHDGPCNGFAGATCWQHVSSVPSATIVFTRWCDDDTGAGARAVDVKAVHYRGNWTAAPENRLGLFSGPPLDYVPTHWRYRNTKEPNFAKIAERLLAPDPARMMAGQKLVSVENCVAIVASTLNDMGRLSSRAALLREIRERLEEV